MADRFPAKFKAGVDADHFEQQPLRAPIAITERVNDVELAIVVRQAGDELLARQTGEVVFVRKLPKELGRLRLDAADIRELCAAFADVDRSQIAGPLIQILKQIEVNRL